MAASGQVAVELSGDLDAESLERLTGELRAELLELDVDAVERPPGGPAPAGSRGAGEVAAQLGTLLVTGVTAPEVLAAVVELLRGWRAGGRPGALTATIDGDTLEIATPTADQQRAVVAAWLERHGGT